MIDHNISRDRSQSMIDHNVSRDRSRYMIDHNLSRDRSQLMCHKVESSRHLVRLAVLS